VLPYNARRCRPLAAKDPNDMLVKAGVNLRQWLGEVPEPDPASDTEAEQLPAWQRWLKGK
jgi:hypothetical protein